MARRLRDPNDYTIFDFPTTGTPRLGYGTLGYENVPADARQYSNHYTSDLWEANGRQYQRVGPDLTMFDNTWAPRGLKEQVINDPVAGNILPLDAYKQYTQSIPDTEDWLGKLLTKMPLIAGGAFTGAAIGGGLSGFTAGEGLGGTGAFDMGQFTAQDVGLGSTNAFGEPWSTSGSFAEGTNPWGVNPRGDGMSFFDDILGELDSFDVGENLVNNPDVFNNFGPDVPYDVGENLVNNPDVFKNSNWWDSLVKSITPGPGSLAKALFGTNKTGDPNNLFDLLSGGKDGSSGLLGTAFSVAPGLAALNYAQNQGTPDLSGLQTIGSNLTSGLAEANAAFDPAALTHEFDVNTGLGRESLSSSLARRGISGSSFGNADMTNFDTARDMGRQQILTQGAGTKAGILNQGATTQASIANMTIQNQLAMQKLKNDLYGRALLAISGGLTPRTNALFSAGGLTP